MKTYQFRKLELSKDENKLKRFLTSAHFKKTLIYTVLGGVGGFLLFYFSQDEATRVLWNDLASEKVLMGMALGVFLTNSPCARGKC